MKLWAVVEDWDNGLSYEDWDYYDNQLVDLFETKQSALNNLEYGVCKDDWKKCEPITKSNTNIGYTAFYSSETLRRRIVEVETEEVFPYVISDSILKDKS